VCPQGLEEHPRNGERVTAGRFWRLRVGNHEAIYDIDRALMRIVVLYLGHRKNVYDDFSKACNSEIGFA